MRKKKAKTFLESNGKYGLLCMEDKTWMGNDSGPYRYDDEFVARLSAEMLCVRLGWPTTRIRAVPFTSATKKKDELRCKVSAKEALRRLENGEEL